MEDVEHVMTKSFSHSLWIPLGIGFSKLTSSAEAVVSLQDLAAEMAPEAALPLTPIPLGGDSSLLLEGEQKEAVTISAPGLLAIAGDQAEALGGAFTPLAVVGDVSEAEEGWPGFDDLDAPAQQLQVKEAQPASDLPAQVSRNNEKTSFLEWFVGFSGDGSFIVGYKSPRRQLICVCTYLAGTSILPSRGVT